MPSISARTATIALVTTLITSAGAAGQTCPGWKDPVGKKVMGGKDANIAQFPSQAALRLTAPDDSDTLFVCGGTAIASDWVMTAAHCFDEIKKEASGKYVSTNDTMIGWKLDVVLGIDDLAKVGAANQYPVSDIKIHPNYVVDAADKNGNDIALIRLARAWTGPKATPSLSNATDPAVPPGAGLMVAGFGLLKGTPQGGAAQEFKRRGGAAAAAGSRRLQFVGLPMVDTTACSEQWPGKLVGVGQICAGWDGGAKDSCDGDSGGPLVSYDSIGCPTHVGIVSWGARDCGVPKAYGVYTRISQHAQWLRGFIPDLGAAQALASLPGAGSDISPVEFVQEVQQLAGAKSGSVRVVIKGQMPIRNNGKFSFDVTSDIAGRLVIIDVDAQGTATQIFPNEFVLNEELSLIRPGKTIEIPGPGYGFEYFRAGPPFGKGRLIALVVPADFPTQLLLTAPKRTKGFKPERSAVGYFMNLLQQIRTHATSRRAAGAANGSAAWAVGSTENEIFP